MEQFGNDQRLRGRLTYTVGLVDDHEVVRRGLREYLEDHDDIQIVAEACNGREAMNMVLDQSIDVLLLDLAMPQFSGLDALDFLRRRSPQTGILVFSGLPASQYAVALLQRGVQGFLSKDCDPEELVEAVRAIGQGHRYLTTEVADLLAQEILKPKRGPAHDHLGPREFQIFLRLAKGESITKIAQALDLSAKTVSTYRARMLKKMGVTSNSDVTHYALKHGLIE